MKIALIFFYKDVENLKTLLLEDSNLIGVTFSPEIKQYALDHHGVKLEFLNLSTNFDYYYSVTGAQYFSGKASFDVDDVLKNNFYGIGWIHDELYQFSRAGKIIEIMAKKFAAQYAELYSSISIFLCDIPFDYGRQNFLPSLMFINEISKVCLEKLNVYKVSDNNNLHYLASNIDGVVASIENKNIWVHLPTTFYDYKFFESEIIKSNFEMVYFNGVKYDPASIQLERVNPFVVVEQSISRLPNELQIICESHLDAFVRNFIKNNEFINAQVKFWINTLNFRLSLFEDLNKNFSNNLPDLICIANHEAGYTSALMNFANFNGVETVVFPHSKVQNLLLPVNNGNLLKILAHPIQSEGVKSVEGCDLNFRAVRFDSLNFTDKPVKLNKVRSIGLMLTGVSEYGFSFTDCESLCRLIDKICSICNIFDVEVIVRFKPSENWSVLLANGDNENLIIDNSNSLDDFIDNCDFIFSVDGLTSALINSLNKFKPCAHLLHRSLPYNELSMNSRDLIPFVREIDFGDFLMLNIMDIGGYSNFARNQKAIYISKMLEAGNISDILDELIGRLKPMNPI